MLGVGEDGGAGAMGVLAQVPAGVPSQLPIARDRTGIRYPGQAHVGRIGQDGGEHHAPVTGGQAGVQMGECTAEPRPAIHLGQQIRDPGKRYHAVEPIGRQPGWRRRTVIAIRHVLPAQHLTGSERPDRTLAYHRPREYPDERRVAPGRTPLSRAALYRLRPYAGRGSQGPYGVPSDPAPSARTGSGPRPAVSVQHSAPGFSEGATTMHA